MEKLERGRGGGGGGGMIRCNSRVVGGEREGGLTGETILCICWRRGCEGGGGGGGGGRGGRGVRDR